MLKTDKLTFSYGTHKVLDGLDLSCDSDRICIMGRSGCGKTTLLRILAGLENGAEGSFETDKGKCGFLFQEDRLIPGLTAAENVRFVMKNSDKEDAEAYLEKVGLKGYGDYYPEKMSGGMQRRCAIARLLAYEPDFMILDEPFRGLDAATAEKCAEAVLECGCPFIAVTHNPEEAGMLSAEIVCIE